LRLSIKIRVVSKTFFAKSGSTTFCPITLCLPY
jgi:hypothetical protein